MRRAHARPALWLEFGVYRGTSINATAALRDTFAARGFPGTLPRVVGFDTFEGIPTEWKTSKRQARPKWRQGAFSWREDHGTPTPPVRAGVELVTGLFNETLGPFLDANAGDVLLVNIDNDLYEGALDVLERLRDRFVVGTRLHFHEYVTASFVAARGRVSTLFVPAQAHRVPAGQVRRRHEVRPPGPGDARVVSLPEAAPVHRARPRPGPGRAPAGAARRLRGGAHGL